MQIGRCDTSTENSESRVDIKNQCCAPYTYHCVNSLISDLVIMEDMTTIALRSTGNTPFGETRVMSPTPANSSLLLGIERQCPLCGTVASEPALCANCGIHGHAVCMGLEYFQNYGSVLPA